MFFWNRNKKQLTEHSTPRVVPRRSNSGRRFSVEIKLLAAQAKEAGLGPKEVADLVGASPYTVTKWYKLYREGGEEGLSVSAETVRRVVNDAGLGNDPPPPKRQTPEPRRFERKVPNALWQIDIFTFELKRLYRVYLVGIIDDHSRYIVSHGLFRQHFPGWKTKTGTVGSSG